MLRCPYLVFFCLGAILFLGGCKRTQPGLTEGPYPFPTQVPMQPTETPSGTPTPSVTPTPTPTPSPTPTPVVIESGPAKILAPTSMIPDWLKEKWSAKVNGT